MRSQWVVSFTNADHELGGGGEHGTSGRGRVGGGAGLHHQILTSLAGCVVDTEILKSVLAKEPVRFQKTHGGPVPGTNVPFP